MKIFGQSIGRTKRGIEWSKNFQRATFYVRKNHLKRIHEIAQRDGKSIKRIVDEALTTYLLRQP